MNSQAFSVKKSCIAVIGIGVLFLMSLALYFLISTYGPDDGTITLCNETQDVIVGGSLAIAKMKFPIEKINPGERQTIQFMITTDADYEIDVRFKSGKSVRGKQGYITRGIRSRDRLVIHDSSMVFEADSVR